MSQDYQSAGFGLLRTALLSLEEGEAFLSDEASMRSAMESPWVREAFVVASRDLLARFDSNQNDLDLLKAAAKTVSRMTFRTTPFAGFAGVSHVEINGTEADQTVFQPRENYLRVVTRRRPPAPSQMVSLQASAWLTAPFLAFLQPKRSGKHLVYQSMDIEVSEKLAKQLKKDPNQIASKEKDLLTRLGVLEPRPDASASAFTMMKEKLSEIEKNREINLDHDFIETFKPTTRAHLSQKTADTVLKASHQMLALYLSSWDLNLSSRGLRPAADEFRKMYGDEEIPLLELFQKGHPLRPFLDKIEEAPVGTRRFDKLLADLMRERNSLSEGVLQLTAQDIARVVGSPSSEWQKNVPAFSTVVETVLMKDGEPGLHLKNIIGAPLIKNFARYLTLDEALTQDAKALIVAEQAVDPGIVFAEIQHEPTRPGVRATFPVTPFLYSNIICFQPPDRGGRANEIKLQDLLVSARNRTIHLRSKSLGKEVRPVVPSLYVPELDGHPIFRFLAAIEQQNRFPYLGWFWGGLANFDVLPRVVFGRVILALARWKISTQVLRQLIIENPALEDRRRLFTEKKWPLRFTLLRDGNSEFFDLKNDFAFLRLLDSLRNTSFTELQEATETTGVTGPEGTFRHDLIIPFLRRQPSPAPFSAPPKRPSGFQETFPPGSEWAYVKLYMPQVRVARFLADDLASFAAKLPDAAKFFFVQYADPEFHLRLRVSKTFAARLMRFANKSVSGKTATKFSIETYERETNRYGGPAGVLIYEKLAQVDSRAAIEFAKTFATTEKFASTVWVQAAFLSAKDYLQAFNVPEDQLKAMIKATRGQTQMKTPESILKALEEIKRSSYQSDGPEVDEISQLKKILKWRSKAQLKSINELLSLAKRHDFQPTGFMSSLIHMSLNRLGMDHGLKFESLILKAASSAALAELQKSL